jgi:serine/threonine protein phosphatase PrpC
LLTTQELFEYTINDNDKFVIMASDGVWEFIANEAIVNLIAPFYELNDINGACEALMKEALYQWTQDDSSVVDDITFIMIFIDQLKALEQ